MNCKDVTYKIELLQSNEELAEDVKSHIESCSSCRTYYELMTSVDRIDEIWSNVQPEAYLPEKIIEYVAENSHWGKRRVLWPAVAGIAASLILGFIIGSTVFNASDTQSQDEYIVTESSEVNYMTQTTDLLYYNTFMMEGADYEK